MSTPEGPASAPGPNPVVQVAWKVAAALAAVLLLFLAVGLLLPGTWTAESRREVDAPPDAVFALLEEPRRWDAWTPWPEVAFTYEGPPRGVGARRSWDDPRLGRGVFTITGSDPPRLLEYRVEVEGGQLVTEGAFRLEPIPSGTLVTWREQGDFGRNPLMSWAALSVGRGQAGELERGLSRLDAAAEGREPDPEGAR